MEGEENRVNDPPAPGEEGSLFSRFTGLLRRPAPEEAEDREPAVIFKDPVAELPRRSPPSPGPGMIIPLRMGKGRAGGPVAPPPEPKDEQPPPT